MEHQQSILSKQQQVVNSLISSKIRKDFFIDMGLLAGSLFVVNSFIVNLPLTLILSIVPKEELRKWLRLILKLLVLTRIMAYLRAIVVNYGLHSRVGSPLPYLRQLPVICQWCYQYVRQWESWRQQAVYSDDLTNTDPDRPSGMELC
jgi:hypothetical protein